MVNALLANVDSTDRIAITDAPPLVFHINVISMERVKGAKLVFSEKDVKKNVLLTVKEMNVTRMAHVPCHVRMAILE